MHVGRMSASNSIVVVREGSLVMHAGSQLEGGGMKVGLVGAGNVSSA